MHVYHPSDESRCRLTKVIVDVIAVWFVLVDNMTSGDAVSNIAPLGDIHVILMMSEPVTSNVNDAFSPVLAVAFSGSVAISSGTIINNNGKTLHAFHATCACNVCSHFESYQGTVSQKTKHFWGTRTEEFSMCPLQSSLQIVA